MGALPRRIYPPGVEYFGLLTGLGPVLAGFGPVLAGLWPVFGRFWPVLAGVGPVLAGFWQVVGGLVAGVGPESKVYAPEGPGTAIGALLAPREQGP